MIGLILLGIAFHLAPVNVSDVLAILGGVAGLGGAAWRSIKKSFERDIAPQFTALAERIDRIEWAAQMEDAYQRGYRDGENKPPRPTPPTKGS